MTVRAALLGLLEPGPTHGYVLKHRYDALFGRERPLRYGQVYSTLSRLERDGLAEVVDVESGEGPERRRYAITKDGVSNLDEWIGKPEPSQVGGPAAMFVKITLSLMSGRPAEAILDGQRAVHLARMRELTRAKSKAAADPMTLLAITFELAHLDADLRWIEETAHRLVRGELLLDNGAQR
jgi:DNA-binding PadR family transcriptional regulator